MNNFNLPKLDSRLKMAADMVSGSVAADIGTDHGYIPIYLLLTKKCRRAIAADINKGPLENAEKNAAACGVAENISFYLTDGLEGIELTEVSDIIICGMGGETQAHILSQSEFVKSGVQIILQPMSAVEKLREYLAQNGFMITDGAVCISYGKVYQCIACRYDGRQRRLSPAELLVGEADEPIRKHKLYPALLKKYIDRTKKEIAGKKKGSLATAYEEALLSELKEIYEKTTEAI